MTSEAASLGLELNWQKTKVQALRSREDVPPSITVLGQEVAMVEEIVYLGSLVHSSTQSSPDISCRNAITREAMQNLDDQIWKSRISISTKLKLYNTCILPIFLYGSECWADTKRDVRNQMVPPRVEWMMTWDGQPSKHTFQLLSKHGISPCLATLCECQMKQMPTRS